MDSMIRIGNVIDKDSQDHLGKLIRGIFEDGFKNHIADQVLIKALETCREIYKVNANVSNCVFSGDGIKAK